MFSAAPWLIVGLGNPGREYAQTRHNIGFLVVDRLAEKYGISVSRRKFQNLFGKGKIHSAEVILAKPMAYMNRSGPPVRQLTSYFDLTTQRMLIIHDDIDIETGRIKIKSKGGHGGHNGLKSLIDAFGTSDFPRLRIGIGRPEGPIEVTDHVLGRIPTDEWRIFEPILDTAEDAVITILDKGILQSMNQFNMVRKLD